MSSNVNYVNTLHIGSSEAAALVGTVAPSLKKGQLALIDAKTGAALDVAGAEALTRNSTVFVATGLGGGYSRLSTPIQGKLVERYAGTPFTPSVQKRIKVGKSDASTFTFIPEDETEYQLNILINDDQRPHGQKQTRDQFHYTTGSGATSGEVCIAIASLFGMKWANGTFKTYGERWVNLVVVSDIAGATAETSDANGIFGSKVLKLTGAPVVAAGEFLTITGVNSNGETLNSVHLVTKVDATNNIVFLDSVFPFETGLVSAGDLNSNDAATQLAANHAFDIIGLVPSDDWNGIDEYEVVDFDAALYATKNTQLDGQEADVFVVDELVSGTGSPYQVYDLEWDTAGYNGVNSRFRWFDNNINPDTGVDFSKGYGMISIVYSSGQIGDFQDKMFSPLKTDIALEKDSPQATDFLAILDAFFGTVLGGEPITSL
jgi:hypothetical protein